MRFLCDRMLGRLCRWLRLMGNDAEYAEDVPDGMLLRKAEGEGLVLLTRDRELASRSGNSLLIASPDLEEQIREFAERFGLRESWFTRCTSCNGELSMDEPQGANGRVPEGVRYGHEVFSTCRSCGHLYWPGTHHVNILDSLNAVRLEMDGQ